jgi:hypothetical protein
MTSNPKVFKNSHKGGIKNDELFSKASKGGKATKPKEQNITRGYQKPLRRTLILGAHLHAEHPCLKRPSQKKKKKR